MAVTATTTADRTAWQQENELRTKELTDKLEAGIRDTFQAMCGRNCTGLLRFRKLPGIISTA